MKVKLKTITEQANKTFVVFQTTLWKQTCKGFSTMYLNKSFKPKEKDCLRYVEETLLCSSFKPGCLLLHQQQPATRKSLC
jgi:hypothetical protein